jgi:peptidoglycan lytic transglycosylase
MKRLLIILLTVILLACGAYLFDQYWIHRYDSLIGTEAARHKIDPDLVWSIIYEETYFSPWKNGAHGEIGLMQVTPAVAREWVAEASAATPEQRSMADAATLLSEADRNVQIGCWYLGKFSEEYRDVPDREVRMLAAYNAGNSRAIEWNLVPNGARPLTEQEFIARINISSTRAYVTSIINRYHKVKAAKGR